MRGAPVVLCKDLAATITLFGSSSIGELVVGSYGELQCSQLISSNLVKMSIMVILKHHQKSSSLNISALQRRNKGCSSYDYGRVHHMLESLSKEDSGFLFEDLGRPWRCV